MRSSHIIAAVVGVVAPSLAQESPEAWISRLNTVVDKPIEVHQEMMRDANGAKFTTKSDFVIADDKHFKVSTEQINEGPGDDGVIVKSTVLLENLADGEWLWMKFTDPLSGQGQVRRVALKELGAKASAAGSNFTEIHPAGFIIQLSEMVDFEEVEKDETTVTLKGKFTEEAKTKMIGGFRGGIPRDLTLVLDLKTAFPISFKVDSYHKVLIDGKFSKLKFLDVKKIDMKQFKFDIPKGVSFRDPAPQKKKPAPPKK